MKHTKGQWQLTSVPFELRNTDSAAAIYGPASLEGGACLIAEVSRSPGDDEATANAKLIAAAPELLTAVKLVVGAITGGNATEAGFYTQRFGQAFVDNLNSIINKT